MSNITSIKPAHRTIKRYYETLGRIHAQGVEHESATRPAFQTLLFDLAKARNWDVLTELGGKHAGNRVIPDATIRDVNFLPRGYWEAKDTKDDLDAEIAKKLARGYPTTNIIFEDTRQGVLYQDGEEVLRVNLGQPQELADLLNRFFGHTEPDIDKFETAVEEFRERVPDLAKGLTLKIEEAHKSNAKFQAAFADFFRLCQHSLNPNISRAAVDEMLVQHLLTERLIRTIFDNEEFTSRNVIAAEVEKVISALVSKSFNRREFLKSLDRFYVAIEDAARGLADFSEKQHFLNTVYERFFQGYSVKLADTHGIVYTPQPIVDFMCASVAEVLEKEFGKTLGSKDVNILDPCTGTGNFIVNILRRIPKRDVKRMYREQLFANEVMLLPYYIAALNIEHAHFEITGEYESFEGLCFVDTLDMAEHAQAEFGFMTQENTARVQRQKTTPITVIIGNPPYNVGQLNENDNNKNRKYPVIDKRISQTYTHDSAATNKNALSDAYVKFFRWAVDRLEGRDGIVCYVSNNSFVDQLAFDGVRKHLAQDFTTIYHVDLHGNVRKNPKISGTSHNVFGIQVGVGITVAIRNHASTVPRRHIFYHRVPEMWRKEEKLAWLQDRKSVGGLNVPKNSPRSAAVPAASSPIAGEDAGATNFRVSSKASPPNSPTGVTLRTRGYLPHVEAPGGIYFITARLADSLPASVLAELKAKREEDPTFDESDRIQQYLDAGSGACLLKDTVVATMVRDALHFFDGDRYRLLAWCIMPNHIHLLFSAHPHHKLEDIMHSLKSYTAHKANALLKRKGAFWQRESYDHLVRDPEEYSALMNYIIGNPDAAGLRDWPWTGYEGQDGQGAPHFYEAAFPETAPAPRTAASTTPRSAAVPAATPSPTAPPQTPSAPSSAAVPAASPSPKAPPPTPTPTRSAAVSAASSPKAGEDATNSTTDALNRSTAVSAASPSPKAPLRSTAVSAASPGPKTPPRSAAVSAASPPQAGEDAGATIPTTSESGSKFTVHSWRPITPDPRHTWLIPENADAFQTFVPIGSKDAKSDEEQDVECIFKLFSGGVKTNRDDVVYDFNRDALITRVKQFIDDYNAEVDRWKRATGLKNVDEFVRYDKVDWSATLKHALTHGTYADFDVSRLRTALYRPYVSKSLYFDSLMNERRYLMSEISPTKKCEGENQLLWLKVGSEWPMFALAAQEVVDLLPQGGSQCFPFYVYDEDGSNRRENVTDWALKQFRAQYTDKKITKWDIFYYVYGLLHHPGYRTKYADNLKRELPRIPFAPDFWAFSKAGKELAHGHLDYEQIEPFELTYVETKGVPLSYRVEDRMRLSKDKASLTVNKSLILSGIPPKCFDYRLGNRSALEWVIDQYQVKKDARTGIVSDPNRAGDPEYIVRLVGQVIRVSLDTVRIVNGLPTDFGG
ncbi:MAG: transposase [Candidatus Hydrogenedentes bacterium]|nr:transposase [Candidatus Hydrogenedentota bacterium]